MAKTFKNQPTKEFKKMIEDIIQGKAEVESVVAMIEELGATKESALKANLILEDDLQDLMHLITLHKMTGAELPDEILGKFIITITTFMAVFMENFQNQLRNGDLDDIFMDVPDDEDDAEDTLGADCADCDDDTCPLAGIKVSELLN